MEVIFLIIAIVMLCVGIIIGALLQDTDDPYIPMEEYSQPNEAVCIDDFEKAAEPLIKFLAENQSLYSTAIVTSTSAELLDGVVII